MCDGSPLGSGPARHRPGRPAPPRGLRPTADIEEVGGTAAFALHQAQRVHHQPGAVTDHTDGAVETHIGELATLGLGFQWILFGVIGPMQVLWRNMAFSSISSFPSAATRPP